MSSIRTADLWDKEKAFLSGGFARGEGCERRVGKNLRKREEASKDTEDRVDCQGCVVIVQEFWNATVNRS